MDPKNTTPRSAAPRERRYRRFDLRYPVHVNFQAGESTRSLEAVSRNVSVGGLLLETSSMIPPRSPVSFVMTLQSLRSARPIELLGEGEVVRATAVASGFTIAVECKHPIAHIEECFPTKS